MCRMQNLLFKSIEKKNWIDHHFNWAGSFFSMKKKRLYTFVVEHMFRIDKDYICNKSFIFRHSHLFAVLRHYNNNNNSKNLFISAITNNCANNNSLQSGIQEKTAIVINFILWSFVKIWFSYSQSQSTNYQF